MDHDGVSGVGSLLEYFSGGPDSAGGRAVQRWGKLLGIFDDRALQDLLRGWITGYEKGKSQSLWPWAPGRTESPFTEIGKGKRNKFGGEIMYSTWSKCSFRCLPEIYVYNLLGSRWNE